MEATLDMVVELSQVKMRRKLIDLHHMQPDILLKILWQRNLPKKLKCS